MWILVLVILLLGAQLNLSALVPLKAGEAPPPWWVGGQLIWPYAEETRTMLQGDALTTFTPLLGIAATVCFLLAAAALLRRLVPGKWFRWLITAGAVFSIVLQVIWLSGWAVLPLLVDAALLWLVIREQISVESLRSRRLKSGTQTT